MDNSTPYFSVIMPVYNQDSYLEEAITSVLQQRFTDWQLVIVDDGSSDSCPDIIARYAKLQSRIQYIRQENRGAAAARNRGIELAAAKWLCYLDSDDVWYENTLQCYYDYLVRHPKAKFIYGYRHRLQDGEIIELPPKYQDGDTGVYELFHYVFLSPLRVCHRADLIAQSGGYDEQLPLCEDYELFLRMGIHTRFEPIGIATGLRRRHAHNMSHQTGFSRLVEAAILVRFWEQYACRQQIPKGDAHKRLGRVFYAAGREYFRAFCFEQCAKTMRYGKHYSLPFKAKLLYYLAILLSGIGKKISPRTAPVIEYLDRRSPKSTGSAYQNNS